MTGENVARAAGLGGQNTSDQAAQEAVQEAVQEVTLDGVLVRERVVNEPALGSRVLLAIDTAIGTSVALGTQARIYEVSSDDPMRHAEVIGTLIARVLENAGVSAAEVTGVVAGIGPGPFTGLRVGIAAAHAFATGCQVPLLPLHGHDAVALAAAEQGATTAVRVVQDARRKELFVTEYLGLDWAGIPQQSSAARLVARADHEPIAGELWPERIPAAGLVQIAVRRLASGQPFESDQALYLRAPDVKPPGAIKRVSA